MLYHFQVIWCWIIMTLKRSLKVIQTGTIRKLGCGFLFAFHSNYSIVPVGILPFRLVWENQDSGATRWWKNFEDMYNRLDSIPACATDERTDRRTEILRRHSPRYAYASCGKNCLAATNCACRRFVSKDLMRKPSFPFTLTKGGSWALLRMSAVSRPH